MLVKDFVKKLAVDDSLLKKYGKDYPKMTLIRAFNNFKHESPLGEPDKRVEDYIRSLNLNEQFGVVLYSNNELVVPGVGKDGKDVKKVFMLENGFMKHRIVSRGCIKYWVLFDDCKTKEKGKSISLIVS